MKLATTCFFLALAASALAFAPRQLVGGHPGDYWCREECVSDADCDSSRYQVCSGTGCGHVCVTPLRKRQLIFDCGPVCAIWCECGNVMDAHGCPTCHCNPCSTLPAN